MHRRFEGAATARLECPGGAIEVVLARGFRLRLFGLMRLRADEVEPLLFPRCRSIHTRWMRTPIDLVWLELDGGEGRVLGIEESLAPGRHARAGRPHDRRRVAALELPPGRARRLRLARGERLVRR